jgi:hypothetical protein
MDFGTLIDWLLAGPAWVQYRTQVDLLGRAPSEPEMVAFRQHVVSDPQVNGLLSELGSWPGSALTSHKSAGSLMHKLNFIADLGLQRSDPGVDVVLGRVLAHQSPQGPFQLLLNTPEHFGGSGQDEWAWMLCDSPNLVYALSRIGLGDDPRTQRAIAKLLDLVRENGWPCAVSPEMGKFRGPGRVSDPCPYANLAMLKALSAHPELQDSPAARIGVETILSLWANRRENHPYLFHMGTDFCKLKAPLVWYDIIHALDVLSQFDCSRRDPRLVEMAVIVSAKADEQGRFTPESVWTPWKEWEFGQKKQPSRWLTLLVLLALARIEKRA